MTNKDQRLLTWDRRKNAAGLNMFYTISTPPPIPLANVEKQTHTKTHSKTQFKINPSPMSELITKETPIDVFIKLFKISQRFYTFTLIIFINYVFVFSLFLNLCYYVF